MHPMLHHIRTSPTKPTRTATKCSNPLESTLRDDEDTESGIGALLAFMIVYPIDNLREQIQCTRQPLRLKRVWQLVRGTVEHDGIGGLYSGLRSGLLGVTVSWSLFFYVYVFAKNRLLVWKNATRATDFENLLISFGAGTAAVIMSNPIWVINTREKLKQQRRDQGVWKNLSDLVRQEGVGKLFAGIGPSLILLLNPAIQFTVYERLKLFLSWHRRRLRRSRKHHSPSPPKLSFFGGSLIRPDILSYDELHRESSEASSLRNRFCPRLLAAANDEATTDAIPTVNLIGACLERERLLNRDSCCSPRPRTTTHPRHHPVLMTSMLEDDDHWTLSSPTLTLSDQLVAGSLSKLLGLLATYPLQVLKSRAHARAVVLDDQYGEHCHDDTSFGLLGESFRLLEMEGISGLYRGLGSKLLSSALSAAIMLSVYERLAAALQTIALAWSRPTVESTTRRAESKEREREFRS